MTSNGAAADDNAVKEAIVSAQQCAPGGSWAVFVGRDVIGSGDRELGSSLMKMFFYTLSESDDLPTNILLMNDGVKLAVNNPDTIEHLQTLVNKGVELLVCGTCLNFYGLSEELKVGTLSLIHICPIVIGQAAEFDYAGTQACRALKSLGLEVVLVNPNPATIMTDKMCIRDSCFFQLSEFFWSNTFRC